MLTGYIGSATFLEAIEKTVDRVQGQNPGMKYICDPVMGDNGKFYVPEELVGLFRSKILPKAFMITPNQFEAECLSELEIKDEKTAFEVIGKLHSFGPQIVVITSCLFENSDTITLYGSSKIGSSDIYVKATIPKIGAAGQTYTGTGDLLCAMLLAKIEEFGPDEFPKSVEQAVNIVR